MSRATWENTASPFPFAYKAITCCGKAFQLTSASKWIFNLLHNTRFCRYFPRHHKHIGPHPTKCLWFRLLRFRSPLLTESLRFLLLGLLRCFSSPTYLRIPMYSEYGDQAQPWPGFPIRKSPDQFLFPDPRRLSQVTASFIGSLPQGIHHTPFVA